MPESCTDLLYVSCLAPTAWTATQETVFDRFPMPTLETLELELDGVGHVSQYTLVCVNSFH
jgi:hypothetical protein